FVGGLVVEERTGFFGRRNDAGEVEIDAAHEFRVAGRRHRRSAVEAFLDFLVDARRQRTLSEQVAGSEHQQANAEVGGASNRHPPNSLVQKSAPGNPWPCDILEGYRKDS